MLSKTMELRDIISAIGWEIDGYKVLMLVRELRLKVQQLEYEIAEGVINEE